jgi:glycerol-3-phosphate dehydrogenase
MTYAFAGLRVLPGGPGGVESAKRETVVSEGRGGMLSVAGGKWTTYRHIGRTVLNKLEQLPGGAFAAAMEDAVPVKELVRRTPLPGISNPNAVAHRLLVDREPGVRMDPLTARQLATHYGSLSFDIARLVNEDPSLGERVHPDGPEIWAQVVYARDHEWAETVDDVARRRMTLTIRGLDTDEVRERIEKTLGDRG